MKHKYLISIDFDNTIARTNYPTVLEPIKETVDFIRALQKHSNAFMWVLNTCRQGKELEEAVEWLEKNQLYPDLVNENAVANEIKFGKSDKISALIYIDDRNYGGLKVPDPETFFDEFEKEQQRKENKK